MPSSLAIHLELSILCYHPRICGREKLQEAPALIWMYVVVKIRVWSICFPQNIETYSETLGTCYDILVFRFSGKTETNYHLVI